MSDRGRRRLPSVREVLEWPGLAAMLAARGRDRTRTAVRESIKRARLAMEGGDDPAVDVESLGHLALAAMQQDGPWLRPVINATGILLNTGLGRAPLASEAAEAVDRIVRGYCNLE